MSQGQVYYQFYKNAPHDTHGWKATDLSFVLAPSDRNLKHPTSPRNFGEAPGQTPKLILTLCLKIVNPCIYRIKFDAFWFNLQKEAGLPADIGITNKIDNISDNFKILLFLYW